MEMNAETVAVTVSEVSSTKKMDEKSTFGELSTEEIQTNEVPVTTKKAKNLAWIMERYLTQSYQLL